MSSLILYTSEDCRRRNQLRAEGYDISLFFLCLSDVQMAIDRVATRVSQGGHDIPDDVIRRRFAAGLRNFDTVYKAEVDTWALYDNSGESPRLLDWSQTP